jgi:hypothetical protein
MENSKYFQYLVGLSALFIAGSAAFFSVFGLSKLFAGATLAVIIMAGSLEFGKLVGASFLYRYWNSIANWLKIYMTVGVITLVVITSAGIFGFLSNAYQGATIDFEKQTTTLLYKEDRLEQLEEDKVYLKDELEQAITSLPDNYPTAKRQLREEYNPKVLALNDQILEIKQDIGDLKVGLVQTGVDVGPAIYLARTFDIDVDTVVKFFILILIFVFDPMAVSLVIAYNVVVRKENVKKPPVDKQINRYKRRMLQDKPKNKPKKITIKKPKLTTVNSEDKKVEVIEDVGRGGKAGR